MSQRAWHSGLKVLGVSPTLLKTSVFLIHLNMETLLLPLPPGPRHPFTVAVLPVVSVCVLNKLFTLQ